MTTAPGTFQPHPLAIVHPGDILDTWCSKSMDRERHLYQPGHTPPLLCLHCHPERDPEKESEDQ